jgi:hypothetical protein
MFAAKVLIVIMMLAMYFANFIFLFADTTPLLWILLFVTLHILYSWCIVWSYAYLKVQGRINWASVLIPALLTTSTLGIVIWIVFRPEQSIRNRYHR